MKLHELIKNARRKAGLTQVQLAQQLGITQATINQYETDPLAVDKSGNPKKSIRPTIEKITELAEILKLDITDFFPEAKVIKSNIVKKELKTNFANYSEFIPLEYQPKNIVYLDKVDMLVGAGANGTFDLELFNTTSKVAVDKSFIKGLNPANLKLFEVVGDSMSPEYAEGDIAIVDMVNHRYDFVKIGGIYVVLMGDVVYIKRVEFLPQGKLKLISLNPKYGDIYPHKEGYECEIIGKVCGKIHYEIYKGLTFDDAGIK
ncbi:XRE family transcriptional regulator [Campylobacter mucosalis]|uniref:Peptidase S24 LexA-like protein n=1 Tax=Campylobacter mucosalis CCUG 21559 TaxID=1032067 RepID=A0A6G5QGU8_9BACT|nr:LexA family transcriptional regulator [Campylobacter mucosalis]QCD44933.1 peptidase S24 LexA-like protein [Campylobacter mucosalis CCUG 21559]